MILVGLSSFALCYLTFLAVTRKPAHAVYGYLIAWMFFPHDISRLPLLGQMPWYGISIFDGVQAIAAAGLVVVLVRPGRTHPPANCRIRWLAIALAAVGTTSFALSFLLEGVGHYPLVSVEFRYRLRPFLDIVYGVFFVLACDKWIGELRDASRLYLILVATGAKLVIEVVVIYYAGIVPALNPWAIHESGRFQGVTLLSFDKVGFVAVAAIGACLYRWRSRRSLAALALGVLLFLPILAGLQKAPLAGAVVVWGAFIWMTSSFRRRVVAFAAAVAVAAVILASGSTQIIGLSPNAMNVALGGTARLDNSAETSFLGRLGLWARATDVLAAEFPFGTGPGIADRHMGSSIPLRGVVAKNAAARSAYEAQVYRNPTGVHNLYLEFVVEHGLLGLILMVYGLSLAIALFRQWKRKAASVRFADAEGFSLVAGACASLIGLGVTYMFESRAKLFFLLLMLLFTVERFGVNMAHLRQHRGHAELEIRRSSRVRAR